MNKEQVKIRKEKDIFLCYFIQPRRILLVNKIGADIINFFFNKDLSIPKIETFCKEKTTRKNIKAFLLDIKEELQKSYHGGYPFIDNELLEKPIAVELQINTTCNLRCKHCCQSNYQRSMSFSKIKKILSILYKENIFEINLVGGEVFLRPDILKIISLCCEEYRFATNIITNATLLSDTLIKKLIKFKNNLGFLVSLEGVGTKNDEIRGAGNFKKTNHAIKCLKNNGFYVEISTTVNALNVKDFREIIDYSKKIKTPCNFNLFKVFKKEQKNLILKPTQYFSFIKKLFKIKREEKINVGITNAAIAAYINGGRSRKECRATLSGLTINVKEEMVPCPFLDEIGFYKNKKLPKFNKNFKKEWDSNFWFEKFRNGNLEECQACSYIFTGDIKKRSPYGFLAFKQYLKRSKRIKNKKKKNYEKRKTIIY